MQLTRRGFALIVVLVLLIAISGLSLAMFDSAGHTVVSSARSRHAPATRAIAESCADRAVAYATAVVAGADDFDTVLTPALGTVYLPPGGTVVQVPTGTVDDEHKFAYLPMGTGGCLVRYDDNSDEMKTLTGVVDDGDEGPVAAGGGENNRKDRDRAIFVTAIGLNPVGGGTLPAAAFDRAPERVTVRRFIGTVSAPAVWAGDQLNTGNNQQFCGLGGITAEGQSGVGGGDCVCGDFNVPGGGTPANCGAACAPDTCSPTAANTASAPVPNPPAPTDIAFDANESWGPQQSSGNILGDRGGNGSRADDLWALYFRDADASNANASVGGTYDASASGAYTGAVSVAGYQPANVTDVFVWDMTQDFDVNAGTGRTLQCVDNAGAVVACSGAPWNVPGGGDYCSIYGKDPVERPCNWHSAGNIYCAQGESPCWKPVARLGDAVDANFLASGRPEQSNGPAFAPTNATALPFVADATLRWDDINADGGCSACAGAATFERQAAKWEAGDTCNANLPTPAIAIFDTVVDVDLGGKFGNGCPDPLHLSIIVRDGGHPSPPLALITQNAVEMTGAACPLTPLPAAGACDEATMGGPNSDCVVLNIDGTIETKNNSFLFGRVEGDTITAQNNICVAGGLTATTAGGDCSTGDGAIQIHNNAELTGTLHSAGDVCIKNNATVEGQIMAADDVFIDNNSTVVFRGGGAGGGARAVAWAETSW